MHEIWKTDKKIINTVDVRNARRNWPNWIGGHASYHSNYLTMILPKPENGLHLKNGYQFFSEGIADTFIHEVGHTMGVKHNKKHDTIEQSYQDWIVKTFNDVDYPVLQKNEKTI
jgi:predicted Zn-dependent protease